MNAGNPTRSKVCVIGEARPCLSEFSFGLRLQNGWAQPWWPSLLPLVSWRSAGCVLFCIPFDCLKPCILCNLQGGSFLPLPGSCRRPLACSHTILFAVLMWPSQSVLSPIKSLVIGPRIHSNLDLVVHLQRLFPNQAPFPGARVQEFSRHCQNSGTHSGHCVLTPLNLLPRVGH